MDSSPSLSAGESALAAYAWTHPRSMPYGALGGAQSAAQRVAALFALVLLLQLLVRPLIEWLEQLAATPREMALQFRNVRLRYWGSSMWRPVRAIHETMSHVTTRPKRPILILWDIDHTLLTIGKISREIYEMAFQEVVGRPLRELAEMAGRTEQAIIVETLMLHGVSEPESKVDRFYAALAEAADELRERMCAVGRRLPGAAEAIAALADDDVVQTVVTGNIKPIAVTKLEVFGLLDHLDVEIGGYGSDGGTRPPLVRKAWRQGQDKYRRTFNAQRVLVIGDTPHDIAAAREVSVQALGVATGSCTVEELMAAQADGVLPDLADTEIFVQEVYRVLCL